jgi:DNA-binding HxlR family transcriptional regulator
LKWIGFANRFPQHLGKLATIHAVSRTFYSDEMPKVEKQDIEWASEFIEVLMHNNSLFFARTSAVDAFQKTKETVLGIILQAPGISQAKLSRSKVRGKILDEALKDLLKAELIYKVEDSPEDKARGRKAIRYYPKDETVD